MQNGRERCGASVRVVARISLSLSFSVSIFLFLTILLPTSLKGDGETAREGRRKRVNQAECVPEREQEVEREQGESWRVENRATGVTSVSICMPT